MAAVIAGLHAIGFGLLILVVAPQHLKLGAAGTFAIGTGITAYTLGMRHAFDADHISAIDNTTRKMMSEGKRPLSVGFFFSLGHSTIVFGLAFLLSIGVRALGGPVQDGQSTLHNATNVIGTTVSGTFLYVIAILNIMILVSIVRIFFAMRRGAYDEQELEQQLNSRGLMNRFFGRRLNAITQPWQMYPVGVLFGLGFDTATGGRAACLGCRRGRAGLPFYAILCLPILFAAGMSLLDTIDGSFMNFAYGWAFSKPVRKVYYNITITGAFRGGRAVHRHDRARRPFDRQARGGRGRCAAAEDMPRRWRSPPSLAWTLPLGVAAMTSRGARRLVACCWT
jgi:high-affinity nickel-transport protein